MPLPLHKGPLACFAPGSLERVRKPLLVRLRLIYNSFIIRISLSFWLTVRRKKRDRKVFAKHFPLILAGTMRTWVIRPRDKKIAKNAAKTALLATDRLNAVWRGVFGSSRRGAQPEEQRSAATTRRLHQKFRLELCASTNADPMARVTSAQNATSSVFFDTTHLPEAGHLFKRGLADAAWPLSAASAQ